MIMQFRNAAARNLVWVNCGEGKTRYPRPVKAINQNVRLRDISQISADPRARTPVTLP